MLERPSILHIHHPSCYGFPSCFSTVLYFLTQVTASTLFLHVLCLDMVLLHHSAFSRYIITGNWLTVLMSVFSRSVFRFPDYANTHFPFEDFSVIVSPLFDLPKCNHIQRTYHLKSHDCKSFLKHFMLIHIYL